MSEPSNNVLRIPVLLWLKMTFDLRSRGNGCRESGAFLLGSRSGTSGIVKRYVCYDDLDPRALDTGIIVMRSCGFSALWAECKRLKLEVLADVHTHGDGHPAQSESDRTNPMISQPGHVALILPRFAGTWGWRFRNIAIYEYLGSHRWCKIPNSRRPQRIRFCWS